MIVPWWERYPGLLEYEKQALAEAGFRFDVVDEAIAERGVVEFRIWVDIAGEKRELLATFPDLYPWFRFEVRTTDGGWLGRHHHPFGGNLCLLGRGTANWSAHDSLADFLSRRLPVVVGVAADPASSDAARDEEHAGEPFSDYYGYVKDAVVLVDNSWTLGADGGTFEFGLEASQDPRVVRGAVLAVADEVGNQLASVDERLARRYSVRISGRWTRTDGAVIANEPNAVLAELATRDVGLAEPRWQRRPGFRPMDVTAAVFPEESAWRECGDAWLFVVRIKE